MSVHKPERGIVGLTRIGFIPFTPVVMLGGEGKVGKGDDGLQFVFQEVRRYLLLIDWIRPGTLLRVMATHGNLDAHFN